jgi:hypothetical protein
MACNDEWSKVNVNGSVLSIDTKKDFRYFPKPIWRGSYEWNTKGRFIM